LMIILLLASIALSLADSTTPRFSGSAPWSVATYRTGTFTIVLIDPTTGAHHGPPASQNVTLAVDPTGSRFSVVWPTGFQYTLANGTYTGLSNGAGGFICFWNPLTSYSQQVQEYNNRILKVTDKGIAAIADAPLFQEEYAGSGKDAGVGGVAYMAIRLRVAVSIFPGELLEWDFAQIAPHPRNPDGTCSAPQIEVNGQLEFDNRISPLPPASAFAVPASCANAGAGPTYPEAFCF